MRRLDRCDRVAVAPSQRPGLLAPLGLTAADCERAAWAVEPSGRKHRGAAAILAALSWALGWRFLPELYYGLAPLRWLMDRGYDWVERNRSRMPFSRTPWCLEHPGDCESRSPPGDGAYPGCSA